MRRELKEFEKDIRENWFANHTALYQQLDNDIERIMWTRPDTSTYRIVYLRHGSYLFVAGDVGDAIYRTGFSSFDEWAKSELGYFAEKCCASEEGRMYRQWDPDVARREAKRCIKEYSEKSWKEFEETGGSDAMSSRDEWMAWAGEHAWDFWREPMCFPDGMRIAPRCHAHLIGLQMATEQLKGHKNGAQSAFTSNFENT